MNKLLSQLIDLQGKPEPFRPGEAIFWDDPHISKQMLEAHLNPNIDAASRKPDTIDRSVEWLIEKPELKPGASLLDLGCGPGLYTSCFARAVFGVTSVDCSRRSIKYAASHAHDNDLETVMHIKGDKQ